MKQKTAVAPGAGIAPKPCRSKAWQKRKACRRTILRSPPLPDKDTSHSGNGEAGTLDAIAIMSPWMTGGDCTVTLALQSHSLGLLTTVPDRIKTPEQERRTSQI